MGSIIKIKRSANTSEPVFLASGELAYSWEDSTGGKLYIGWGEESNTYISNTDIVNAAENIAVIGGKYFVDKLDHTPGVLTANSAIIVDDNLSIDILNIGNITITENSITSSANDNILISSIFDIDVNNSKIINVLTPIEDSDAATKGYVDEELLQLFNEINLDIIGDSGTGNIILATEPLTFTGINGISTEVDTNTLSIILNNTGVIANTYGSTTEIPVLTINEQGQITAANLVSISTDLNIAGDIGDDVISLADDTLTFVGGTGINSFVSNNQVEFNLNDTGVIANTYGSTTEIPVLTINEQGQITFAEVVGISTNLSIVGDIGNDIISLAEDALTFVGGTGINSFVSDNSVEFNLDDTGVTANTYGSSSEIPVFTINEQGQITFAEVVGISTNLSIAGDLGNDVIALADDTLTFIGGTGIDSFVSDNSVEFNLDNTGVIANTYGDVDSITVFTVDAQGRLASANTVPIEIVSSQITDFTEVIQDIIGTTIEGDADSGITVNYNDANNIITISAENATDTQKGVSNFNSVNFTVTDGNVVANDISFVTESGNASASIGQAIYITGDDAQGIDTAVSNNEIIITAKNATDTQKGVASFDSNNFSVASGVVTTNDFTIGTTAFTLGETTTVLEDLTYLSVGNIFISNNTISIIDSEGDIILSPNGSGVVSVNNSRITNLLNPNTGKDAATKEYVDTIAAASLHYHDPVRVEVVTILDAVYDNGADGQGATLTNNGTQDYFEADGIALEFTDRVLVYRQTNAYENGIYQVSDVGSPTTNWVLTRTADTDTYAASDPNAFGTGDAFFVTEGNTGAGELYVMTTPGVIDFGNTAITFSQIASTQIYKAGDGLSIDGVTFSVNVDNSSIEIFNDILRVKASGVTNTMLSGSITNDKLLGGITNDKLAGSITNNKLLNPWIFVDADTGNSYPVDLGETLEFVGGIGISTEVSNNQIIINGEDATTSTKGISKFAPTDFIVTSGEVFINDEKIQDTVAAYVQGGRAITITYEDNANTLIFDSDIATTSTLGVASFTVSNFSVSLAGEVAVTDIDGGSY